MRGRKSKKSNATKAVQGITEFLIMFLSLYLLLNRLTSEEGSVDERPASGS